MRPHPLGVDGKTGIVHYDSLAKHRYIWPLCSTPHLDLIRVRAGSRVVTCVACLVNAVKYGWDDNVLR
jgi:hypothetical protein